MTHWTFEAEIIDIDERVEFVIPARQRLHQLLLEYVIQFKNKLWNDTI